MKKDRNRCQLCGIALLCLHHRMLLPLFSDTINPTHVYIFDLCKVIPVDIYARTCMLYMQEYEYCTYVPFANRGHFLYCPYLTVPCLLFSNFPFLLTFLAHYCSEITHGGFKAETTKENLVWFSAAKACSEFILLLDTSRRIQ